MNAGGIRANIDCAAPPCVVTFGQVFTVQPFGNSLVVMTLTGEMLKSLLESQHTTSTGNPYFLQPSAEVAYTWQSDAAPGQRVRDLRIAGEPVRDRQDYRITVNSFLAEGGDGFALLKQGRDRVGGGQDIDALIAYLAAGERSPVPTPRITRLPPPEPRK
jgi:5'-nucleotidase